MDSMSEGIPAFERAQWDGNKLLNRGALPLWSGKGEPPAIGSSVPVGKGLTVRVYRYEEVEGWLMIIGERSDGRWGNLAGTEIVWPKD